MDLQIKIKGEHLACYLTYYLFIIIIWLGSHEMGER